MSDQYELDQIGKFLFREFQKGLYAEDSSAIVEHREACLSWAWNRYKNIAIDNLDKLKNVADPQTQETIRCMGRVGRRCAKKKNIDDVVTINVFIEECIRQEERIQAAETKGLVCG